MSTDTPSTPFKTMIALAGFWLTVAASVAPTSDPANDNRPGLTPGGSPSSTSPRND